MIESEPTVKGQLASLGPAPAARRYPSEQFIVPSAAEPLPFDGARLTGEAVGQVEIEHLHRYCLARDLCVGRDVLDLGSGEGYGSALLAGVARQVTGVELDTAAVRHSQRHHARANLGFVQGNAGALPLGAGAVDVIVCFEVLEHLAAQEELLVEIERVLRPGGLLVMSTPDRLVYSGPGREPNPHHVRELTEPEFVALLRGHFRHVVVMRQRAAVGSVIAGRVEAPWRSFDRRRTDLIEASNGLVRADYLIALASTAPLPEVGPSTFFERVPVDAAFRTEALQREVEQARAALTRSEEERRALLSSSSWRLTAPLRAAARAVARWSGAAKGRRAVTAIQQRT